MEDIAKQPSSTGGHSGLIDDENDSQPIAQIQLDANKVSINDEQTDDSDKKGRKITVNSGQLDAKQNDDANDTNLQSVSSDILDGKKEQQYSRYDTNGNPITTFIGTYSLAHLANKSKNKKKDTSPGTGEVASPDKGEIDKKKRHRLTFGDEVSNDKTQLTEIHYIESYKKYNQEFYIENQVQGCCTTF